MMWILKIANETDPVNWVGEEAFEDYDELSDQLLAEYLGFA